MHFSRRMRRESKKLPEMTYHVHAWVNGVMHSKFVYACDNPPIFVEEVATDTDNVALYVATKVHSLQFHVTDILGYVIEDYYRNVEEILDTMIKKNPDLLWDFSE